MWTDDLAHLDSHVGSSRSDETERSPNVNLHDDVPRIVGCCMKHSVIGEASIIHDMVQLPVLPKLKITTTAEAGKKNGTSQSVISELLVAFMSMS